MSGYQHHWGSMIFATILLLTFWFNFYKVPLTQVAPYNMFPWSENPHVAKMEPFYLHSHLLSALLLSVLSYLRYSYPQDKIVKTLFYLSHLLFTIIITLNLNKLGDMKPDVAMMVNGGILLLLQLLVVLEATGTYILVLSTPVFLEVAAWTYARLTLIFFILFHGPY